MGLIRPVIKRCEAARGLIDHCRREHKRLIGQQPSPSSAYAPLRHSPFLLRLLMLWFGRLFCGQHFFKQKSVTGKRPAHIKIRDYLWIFTFR
jgi:hypothetical protein